MIYISITTAERGWFFVQTDHEQIKKNGSAGPIIQRVAAWALTDKGEVVGLIGVDPLHDATGEKTRLWEPNPLANGAYKHYNDLSPAELAILTSDPRPNRAKI